MPTQITPLPTPPSRNDPANFSTRADAFLGQLPTFATEANALALETNGKALEAANSASASANSATDSASSASNALSSAANAAAATGAALWVSGTTYAVGALVWSPINARVYRRLVAGAGTTDPSSDATNWKVLSTVVEQSDIGTDPNQIPLNQYLGNLAFQNSEAVQISGGIITAHQIRRTAPVIKTTSFTVSDTDHYIICNGTTIITATLPDAATNTGRELCFRNIAAQPLISAANNVVLSIGIDVSNMILIGVAYKWATLVSDGTNWIVMQAN